MAVSAFSSSNNRKGYTLSGMVGADGYPDLMQMLNTKAGGVTEHEANLCLASFGKFVRQVVAEGHIPVSSFQRGHQTTDQRD